MARTGAGGHSKIARSSGSSRSRHLGGMTAPMREVRHMVLRAPWVGVGGRELCAEPVKLGLTVRGRGKRLVQALF